MNTKKSILSILFAMIISISSASAVFAADASGSYSAKFSMSHMIIGQQSLYLSGSKIVSGSVNITQGAGAASQVKLSANLVTPQTIGYKIYCSTGAGTLTTGSRTFSFSKRSYPSNTYYLALIQGSGVTIKGILSYKWS